MVRYKNNHRSLLTAFLAFIREQNLIEEGETTLLAVSGGVDSVAMSALFYEVKLSFALAHCHFGLRGTSSDQDAVFVRKLAQQYGVKFYTRSFNTLAYARSKKLSIQMAARALRYQWLEELRTDYRLHKIATAHHVNDSFETLLINLTKGTGIAGLRGIAPRQGKVIRPLLFADKASLIAYVQGKQLAWQEDGSNAQNHYIRNCIRNQVIPVLKTINPNLIATSRLAMARLGQIEAIFQEHVSVIRQQILRQDGEKYYVNIQHVRDMPWAAVVLEALLKPFGFHFAQLSRLLNPQTQCGKMIASAHYQLYVDRSKWIIIPYIHHPSPCYTIATSATQTLEIQHGILKMQATPSARYTLLPDARIAALDLAKLSFPLTVRRWQPGDFFYPLGMQQRKKLSDFLVDCKVPRPNKEAIYVMLSGAEVVWVMGYRITDRFKITHTTQMVYEARLILRE